MRQFSLRCKDCGDGFIAGSGSAKRCTKCRFVFSACKRCGIGGCFGKKFCSLECRKQWLRDNPSRTQFKPGEPKVCIKTCVQCGEIFAARSGSQKWCKNCCVCELCGKQLLNGSDRFCGNSCAGKWKFKSSEKVRNALRLGFLSPSRGIGISKANTGKPRPNMRGDKNPQWKGGGLRKERQTEMGRVEYLAWRASVFKRDEFSCAICGSKEEITAHHIKPWASHKHLRYEQSNGITLCSDCHYGVNRHEEAFESRFIEKVQSKANVTLTAEEIESFCGVKFNCLNCSKPGRRPRYHKNKKRMFCNILCMREWELAKKSSLRLTSCN